MEEKFISSRELIEYLGMCYTTIRGMERRGMPYYKPGRKKLYKLSEVEEWVKSQKN